MTTFRIALANVRYPATPDESVMLAEGAIARLSPQGRLEMSGAGAVVLENSR